ncbi:MAG: DUF3300 domain-containing protein [Steroidobacteraceae bacterium]
MITFEPSIRLLRRSRSGQPLAAWLLSATLLLAAAPRSLLAQALPAQPAQQAPTTPTYTPQSPQQLQQLVAPIALYPDSLVASILPAATFPEEVVEADRWLQGYPGLTGDALAQAVNQQSWDASVKALTAFPAILGNMDKNLAWTSSLGDAYYNQPQDVMSAIQALRQSAEAAGNLKSTPQQDVTTEDSDIEIQPTEPDVVYVPEYDPWDVYGFPIPPWALWYDYPGIWFGGPYISFGIGIPIGFFGGFSWGWGHWGCDWRGHFVAFDRARYASRSVTFFNRNNFYRSAAARGAFRVGAAARGAFHTGAAARGAFHAGAFGRPGAAPHAFGGNPAAARGYAAPRGQIGIRSGAFSGFARGGEVRGFAARGRASFGGGGARGGGARRGGGRGHR